MSPEVVNHVSGGIFFSAVIQGKNITLTLPDRPDPALAGLPRKSATFAGRQDALEEVLSVLAPPCATADATEQSRDAVVVTGLPGAGKTELLLQASHRAVREEGWFPGGVLFIDLHGYETKRKVTPKRALGTLLRALGIPSKYVPPRLDDRARLYRSVLSTLADAGRRVLVVLDDVPPTEKSFHLLPGDGKTVTLMSSRHLVSELDALTVTLRELPTAEGRGLLDRALRSSLLDDSRVTDQAEAADRLVTLCGGLPLALRILASLLIDAPTRPLASLTEDLEVTHARLSLLAREERAVTAAFELSYRHLSPDQAEVFRFMSLHPGADFSTQAAAQLCGKEEKETELLLLKLTRKHLVEPREPYGRWQQHSLLRLYARKLISEEDDPSWVEGFLRLLTYFHKMTTLACSSLFEPTDPEPAEDSPFNNTAEAIKWLEAERVSLIISVTWAHEAQDDFTCIALAQTVSRFLTEMRYLEDAQQVISKGIISSRRMKDRLHEAAFLSQLGLTLRDMKKLRKSVRAHRQAVKITRRMNKSKRLAQALNNLGLSLHDQRKFDEALNNHVESARLFKRAADRHGLACTLSNAGETLIELNRLEEACRELRKAAKIFRKIGDHHSRSQALGSLAKVKRHLGMVEQAVELHRRALDMTGGVLPLNRAIELTNFGHTLTMVGEHVEALEALREALSIFRSRRERRGEAMVLGNMAIAYQDQGEWSRAERLHTLALEIFIEGKDDHRLAIELGNLAFAQLQLGRHSESLTNLELAAALYHQVGDTERAAESLDVADRVRQRVGVAAYSVPELP
ncbi:tetratricopeptide repeat protein [Streptomyces sp. NPDC047002]|uniref:tetratricopeptide repeat protein n=1 Tax=Streptomyces sp. NPDC047002 TaxID=3155475 RepID=UPI003455D1D4